MKPKYYSSFLIVFFLISTNIRIFSQTTIKQIQILNHYIDFSNQNTHALSLIADELESFDYEIEQFRNQKRSVLNFKNDDFWRKTKEYRKIPEKIYRQALSNSFAFPSAVQTQLNSYLDRFFLIMADIYFTRDTLQDYLNTSQYKNDPEQKRFNRYLQSISDLYESYRAENVNFNSYAKSLFESYQNSNSNDPYISVYKSIEPVFELCQRTLIAARTENTAELKKILIENHSVIWDKMKQKNKILAGISQQFPKTFLEASKKYDSLLIMANEMYKALQDFGLGKVYSAKYLDKGVHYHLFNDRLVQSYNRIGKGVAYQFNRFVEYSHIPLLYISQEVPLFVPKNAGKKKDETLVLVNDKQAIIDDKKMDPPKKDTLSTKSKYSMEGFSTNNLIFLLDVSASMNSPEKLPVLKEAYKFLVSILRPEDQLSIVVYSGHAKVVMQPVSASNKNQILSVLQNLKSGGSTDIKNGLNLSYKVATDNYIPKGNNRIILATDGGFNIKKDLYKMVENSANGHINLSVFYLNRIEDEVISKRLSKLAKLGKGNFYFLTPQNAQSILVSEAQKICYE